MKKKMYVIRVGFNNFHALRFQVGLIKCTFCKQFLFFQQKGKCSTSYMYVHCYKLLADLGPK